MKARMQRGKPGWVSALGTWLLWATSLQAEPLALRQSLPAPADARCPTPAPVVRQLLSDRSSVRDRPAQVFVASDLVPGSSGQIMAYRLSANGNALNAVPAWDTARPGALGQAGLWYTATPSASHGLPGYRAFAQQFQARPTMLYAGGSAGLLHGFDAATGQERLAYVPRGVLPTLPWLTASPPGSSRPLTVDGPVFTGDANTGTNAQPEWRTLLVGSLGRGGKGYFVLDVSDPANFGGSDAAATKVVRLDRSEGSDPDIGHLTGHPVRDSFLPHHSPQITQLNDGRWAVLLGNGANSANEDPVLLVQYLDGGSPNLRKIPAASGDSGQALGNGLATPRPVDLNGDGSADVVYAGDLQGHLWKFDLLSSNPADWGVAFSGPRCTLCTPLFQARNAQGRPQPITAAPVVGPEARSGGLVVAFGTGRLLTDSDDTDTAVQTVYAVLDHTRYQPQPQTPALLRLDPSAPAPSPVTGGRSALRERRLSGTRLNSGTPEAGPGFWTLAEGQARVAYTGADTVQGWYLDLPETGERVLQAPEFLDGSQILQVRSRVPAALVPSATACPTAEDRGFLTLLGLTQGLAPSLPLLDANGDGRYQTQGDRGANRTSTRSTWWGLACPQGQCQVEGAAPQTARTLAPLPKPPRTLQWRQLQ